jgi:hypothetical protein
MYHGYTVCVYKMWRWVAVEGEQTRAGFSWICRPYRAHSGVALYADCIIYSREYTKEKRQKKKIRIREK